MNNDQWRQFFRGYFHDENPWAPSDESKREWREFFWEFAFGLAAIGFVIWLSYFPHGR